jgi:hypothetical protein
LPMSCGFNMFSLSRALLATQWDRGRFIFLKVT